MPAAGPPTRLALASQVSPLIHQQRLPSSFPLAEADGQVAEVWRMIVDGVRNSDRDLAWAFDSESAAAEHAVVWDGRKIHGRLLFTGPAVMPVVVPKHPICLVFRAC